MPESNETTNASNPWDEELQADASFDDVADEMFPEYIKAKTLEKKSPFLIVGARTRVGQFGPECVFDIRLLKGDDRGASATLTLAENEGRLKLVKIVNKKGRVGPAYLVKEETKKGQEAWGFLGETKYRERIEAEKAIRDATRKRGKTKPVATDVPADLEDDDDLPF